MLAFQTSTLEAFALGFEAVAFEAFVFEGSVVSFSGSVLGLRESMREKKDASEAMTTRKCRG